MNKIIFFDFVDLLEHKDIKINYEKYKEKKEFINGTHNYDIIKIKKLNTYFSYIENNNNKYLFFKNENRKKKLLNNKNIIKITEKNYFIKNDFDYKNKYKLGEFHCASHNMSFFNSKDNLIYSIGGKCNSKATYNKKNLPTNYKINYINFKNKIIIDPNTFNKYYANGLYLFNFQNNKLVLKEKKPIISFYDLLDSKYNGVASLDSHICCFYDKNISKYRLYCRMNLDKGIRSIQTSLSNDLFKWQKFKLLNFIPTFNHKNDNYYCINVFNYPNSKYYIGISPYLVKSNKYKNDGIYILFSRDGLNWLRCNKIVDFNQKYINAPIYSVVQEYKNLNNKINFLLDYTKFKKDSQKIYNFTYDIDRITSITSKNDTEGFIILKKYSNNIIINFKTLKRIGYIKINEIKYKGDFINKKIQLNPSNNNLKIIIKNAFLYSIIYE